MAEAEGSRPASVDELLAEARALGLERLDARLLLAHALGRQPAWVHAHGDARLLDVQSSEIRSLFAQRADGQPVSYLTGQREFFGLPLLVSRAVLDPRPDTETLAQWALDILSHDLQTLARPRSADLGTGSGAIALALAQHCSRALVCATDSSASALQVARANATRLGLSVHFFEGYWLEALQGQTFDLIVSNPPYLAHDDPHLTALHAEPRSALVAGPDGLSDLLAIIEGSRAHLHAGGWLLLEHGCDQSAAVAAQLGRAGYGAIAHRLDLAGHVRCTGGRWLAGA